MKRGWILFWSVLVEVLTGSMLFIPIPLIWRGVITIVAVLIVGFCLIYFWWAPNNLFFTFVPEGRAKVIIQGDAFKKILIQWEGYELDDNRNVVEGGSLRRSLFGGLKFYGLWPVDDIYIYDFQWTGIKEDGNIDPHPKETLDYVLLKDDVYGLKEEKAEDKNLLPLNVTVALTVRVVNPYKALFNVQNWLETLYNRIRPYIRDFITTGTYEEFIVSQGRMGPRIYSKLEEEGIINEFWDRYGIEIRKIEVKDIDPGEDFRRATLAKYLAEREKEKVVVEAEAEKQRLEKVYGKIGEFGDLGKFIRTLEALEKSPGKGSKWVVPFPDELLSIFKKGGEKK